MSVNSLIERSRRVLGNTSVLGDLTFASGKGINFDSFGIKITDTYIQFGDDATALGPKLVYSSATYLQVRNAANDADAGIGAAALNLTTGLYFDTSAGAIFGRNVDNAYVTLQVRDNGVARAEIARLVGAADPYFMVGRDDTGVALNAVTDGLKLQMAGGTGNSSAGQGFGMPFLLGNAASETEERASIDCVLVTATNGAEDARFDFNVQAAGAAPATIMSLTGTTATFNGNVVMGTQIIDADSGAVTFIDMPAGASADGTEQSLVAALDGVAMFTLYGKSDGAGAVDERALHCGAYLKLLSTDTDSAVEGHVWYDASTHTIVYHNGTAVKTLADVA